MIGVAIPSELLLHRTMSASPSKSPEPNAESSKDASEASNSNKEPENTGVEAKEVDEAESNSNSGDESDNDEPPPPPPNAWQAIFSPQHNAYYFYNSETNETTWTNPLQPPDSTTPTPAPSADVASASASTSKSPEPSQPEASTSSHNALQQAAIAAGIDPSLAYLDPSLAMSASTGAPPNTFTAKFNARTGAFTAADSRDPGHLSEFEVRVFCLSLSYQHFD